MSIGGFNTVVKHGTNGATSTLTTFTTKMRGANIDLQAEQVESTTFGSTYKSYEQTFKSGTLPLTYKYDTTVWGQLTAIYNNGDTVDFEVDPDGTTTGKPKITGSMFITKLSMGLQVGSLEEIQVDWQISGAVVFGSN